MPSLLATHTSLSQEDREWLIMLVQEWHLLADTSFSDLILWVPDGTDENVYWAVAQIRPSTGPTALEDDVIGECVAYDPEHLVTEAFLAEEICETSDNQLRAGIPVDVWAIPVLRDGRCIGVVERHTNRMGVRAPGALEDAYLEVADVLAEMTHEAGFPQTFAQDGSVSPRVGDGMMRITPGGIISYASPNAISAYRRLGYSGDLLGDNFMQTTKQLRDRVEEVGQTVVADFASGRPVEFDLENRRAAMRMRIIPLRRLSGDVGLLALVRDTTDLRSLDRELVTKDATIREIHHRVKNNLQTVAALLRLQSRRMVSDESKNALREAMARVQSIAVVHELLSQSFNEAVPFDDVVDRVLKMVGDVAASSGEVIARREGSFGLVPAEDATALAMIITELCQNAVEHGHRSGSGEVVVRYTETPSAYLVDILDNGEGIADDFDIDRTNSLGLSIVRTLVGDLDGTFELTNRDDGTRGSRARITLPVAEKS